jgi:hypothetical protein
MRRVVAVGLTFVAMLGVTGCGDDATSSACDLLTTLEATSLLGEATRPGVEDDDEMDNPGTSCAWISESSSREAEAAVYGVSFSEASGAEARDAFEDRRDEPSPIFTIEPVDGVGDEAYFVVYTEPNSMSGTPSLPVLYLRTDDRLLSAGTFDSDEHPVAADEAKTLERGAARLAVARLAGEG